MGLKNRKMKNESDFVTAVKNCDTFKSYEKFKQKLNTFKRFF